MAAAALPSASRRGERFCLSLLAVAVLAITVSSFMRAVDLGRLLSKKSSSCGCFDQTSLNHPLPSAPATKLTDPKPCPDFQDGRRGVVLFFHVSKAGGTTIRRLFQQRLANVDVRVRATFADLLPELKEAVEGSPSKNNKTLIVEIHDGRNLNLVEMATILSQLRQRAHINNVPFFCFTTLREPLEYMVSYYNYEHVGSRSARYERGNATESDFKRLSLQNPQCLFFARGEHATWQHEELSRRDFHIEECISTVYPLLQQHMDWVGTLEDLQTSTLPLLSFLLMRNKDIGASFTPQNVQRPSSKKLQLDKLSNETLQFMRNITQGDLFLYRSAKREYSMSMWTNY